MAHLRTDQLRLLREKELAGRFIGALGAERRTSPVTIRAMNLDHVVKALEAERSRIDQALAALRGVSVSKRRGRRPLSAAARRRISLAQKKRWAAQRKK